MRRKLLLPFYLLIAGFWGFSLEAEPIQDLAWALRYAKDHNPEMAAFRAKVSAAKARIPQEIFPEDPQVGVNFYEVPTETANPFDTTEYRYFVEQKIPFFTKFYSRGKIAGKEKEIAEEAYRSKENEILTEVKHAYHDLDLLEWKIKINRENQSLLKAYEKTAMTQYSTKAGHFQDIIRASVEIGKLEEESLLLEKEKKSHLAKLNRLLGRKPEESLSWAPMTFHFHFHYKQEEILALAKAHQPDLQAARYTSEKEKSATHLARQSYLPDFSLGAEYMDRQNTNDILSYKVGIEVPLFGLWKQRKGVQEAKARYQSARSLEQDLANRLEEEVTATWAEFQRSQKTAELYEQAILPQAEAAVRSAQISYESGQITFLELVDLQRTLKEVQEKYRESATDYEKSIAHLEFLVGKDL